MRYRAKSPSTDGSTIKYVLDAPTRGWFASLRPPGNREKSIESAFIHIPDRADGKPEYILCLSSMVGCVYRCLMCANKYEAFYGCLSPSELNEQIELTLEQDGNLEKIMSAGSVEYAFMAIGEPLYGNNVIKAIQQHIPVVDDPSFDTRFALTTVGAPGTITKLTKAELPFLVRLELSLHFPNDRWRNQWLVPNHWYHTPKLSISQMLEEAEAYVQKHPETGKVTLNYTLIDGWNNMDESIQELSELIRGKEDIFYVKVMWPNLIDSFVFSWKREFTDGEWAPGMDSRTYSPSEFRDKLEEAGVPATEFKSKGTDIWAGCGMMIIRSDKREGIIPPEKIPQADPALLGFK